MILWISGGDTVCESIIIHFRHHDDYEYVNQHFPKNGIFSISFGNQKHKDITFEDGIGVGSIGTGNASFGYYSMAMFQMNTNANNAKPTIMLDNRGDGCSRLQLNNETSKDIYHPQYYLYYFTFGQKTCKINNVGFRDTTTSNYSLTAEYPDGSDTFSKIDLYFRTTLYYGQAGKYDSCEFTIPKFKVDDLIIEPYINTTSETFGFCSQEYSKKITSWKYTIGHYTGSQGYIEFDSTVR